MVKHFGAAVVLSLALAGALAPALAQGRYLRLDGWVQWVASDRMQLILDSGQIATGAGYLRIEMNRFSKRSEGLFDLA